MALGGAALGTAIGYLMLDTTGFQSGFRSALQDLRTFQDQSTTLGGRFQALGSAMTTVGASLTKGVTLPIVGAGAAAVNLAAEFEKGMSQVQAITGATGTEFESLKDLAIDLGSSTAFSASEVTDAMTELAKAGFSTEQVLDGVGGVLDAAAASGENLATTSTIVADAITGFGLAASDSTRVADLLTQAANSGTIGLTDLGESFKYVAPVAKAMGMSIEDVTTAVSAMSMAGIKGSQAGTGLRTMLTNLASPTNEVAGYMQALGISLTDASGKIKPLNQLLSEMRVGFEKLTEAEKAEYAAGLAGKEGMSALLSLMTMTQEEYDALSESMYNSQGVAKETAEIMQDNLSSAMEQLGGALESLAISFGQILIPILTDVVQWLTGVVDRFNQMDEGTKKVIITIAGIAAAIGPLFLIVGKIISVGTTVASVISKIIALIGGAGGLSTVLGALTGPIGIVVAAVAALAVAWSTNFGGIRDATTEVFNAIKEFISTIMEAIRIAWENDLYGIRTTAETVWNLIKTIFETAFTIISDLFYVFAALFRGDWEGLWEAVKTLVNDIWEGIKNIVSLALDAVLNLLVGIAAGLYNAAVTAFNEIERGFKEVWSEIDSWFQTAKEDPVKALNDLGSSLYSTSKAAFGQIFQGFKDGWSAIAGWVTDKVQWIKNKFAEMTNATRAMSAYSSRGGSGPGGTFASGIDYVPRDMLARIHEGEAVLTKEENKRRKISASSGGDVYNFYSPEPLTPVKAAREFKRVKQELALGYR